MDIKNNARHECVDMTKNAVVMCNSLLTPESMPFHMTPKTKPD